MGGHIWLVGMMGSGKTVLGRAVAQRLDRPFVDIDDVIVARAGRPIRELWANEGEAAFRHAEAQAIVDAAAQPGQVIATGGGAVLRPSSVATMRESGMVVWLQAEPATLARRVGRDPARPLLAAGDVAETLKDLLAHRTHAYAAAAHASVATDSATVATVADRIEELWNGF